MRKPIAAPPRNEEERRNDFESKAMTYFNVLGQYGTHVVQYSDKEVLIMQWKEHWVRTWAKVEKLKPLKGLDARGDAFNTGHRVVCTCA